MVAWPCRCGSGFFAVGAAGTLLWTEELGGQALDWALHNDRLLLTTAGVDGSLWRLDEAGPTKWIESLKRPFAGERRPNLGL